MAQTYESTYLDASPLLIEVYDDKHNLIDCTKSIMDLYGASTKEEYFHMSPYLVPVYQPCGTPSKRKAAEMFRRVMEKGTGRHEWVSIDPCGGLLPLDICYVRLKRNEKVIVVAYAQDLRPLREADVKIREAEELNSLFLNSAPFSINWVDEKFKPIDCNEYTLELFGFKHKADYWNNLNRLHPELQPCGTPSGEKLTAHLKTAMEEGRTSFEWLHYHNNGEEIPTEIVMVKLESNRKFIIATYTKDMRPVKAAMARENELRMKLHEQEMNERIKIMLDGSPFSVTLYAPDRTIVDCNMEAVNLFKFETKEQLLKAFNERFFDFFPPCQPCGTPTVQKLQEQTYEVLEKGRLRTERIYIDANGEEFPAETTMTRIDFRGAPMVAIYSRDLREARTAEEKIREAKIAEENNRAKTNFLARMSHEIRTPITAVMGISEIHLQDPDIPTLMADSFARIHNSASHLLGIVNDVLDISKIEAGKMELLPEEYETAAMIADVAHLHFVHLNNPDIEFNLWVDENLPAYLFGDILRIEQVINNLLTNAFKYTERGMVKLSIKCRERAPNRVELIISVSDTGLGMTREQLEILQNSEYTRFHEQGNRLISGTGLGMPIIFNLLELMNGRVKFESEVGKGTTITVYLPQKAEKPKRLGRAVATRLQKFEEIARSVEKRFSFTPDPMPYGRVLVVDDTEATLFVSEGLLAFYELQIETCRNGFEALEKIEQGNVYDIVFMDEMMPGINGTETMRHLREIGYTRPIVALTANALIGQAEEYIRNGFDAFISKPIQPKLLNSVLNKFVRDKQPNEVVEAARAERNTNDNINSFQSNAEVVGKLKENFARNHQNTFFEITRALNTGDRDTALRLAHTLKGTAGLIHEPELAHAALLVESAIRNGETPTAERLSGLEAEWRRVLESIAVPEVPAFFADFDAEKTAELFDALYVVLEAQNADALDFIAKLKKIPETAVLVRQIEDFDFKSAAKTLSVLKNLLASKRDQ